MPEARRDLDEIFDHVADDNPDAAARLIERLLAAADLLAHQSRAGRLRLVMPEIRSRTMGRYRIFYEPLSSGIRVIGVIHTARLWLTIIQDRLDD